MADKTETTERMVKAIADLVSRQADALRKDFRKMLDAHLAEVAKFLEEQDRRIDRHAAHLARHETKIQQLRDK